MVGMKDAQPKPGPSSIQPKSAIKKEKPTPKKSRSNETPILKISKGRKRTPKNSPKKKEKPAAAAGAPPTERRKRGRPKNDSRPLVVPRKILPKPARTEETATSTSCDIGKVNLIPIQNIKVEKESSPPPSKKMKVEASISPLNGNWRPPAFPSLRPWIQRGESPTVVEQRVNNGASTSGEISGKKTSLVVSPRKPSFTPLIRESLLAKPSTSFGAFFPLGTPTKKDANTSNSTPQQQVAKKTSEPTPSTSTPVSTPSSPPQKSKQKSPLKDIKVEEATTSEEEMRAVLKSMKVERPDESPPATFEPIKSHPQRMASLDAMAKMHVICTADRKFFDHPKTITFVDLCAPSTSQKAPTINIKKEIKEPKPSTARKQAKDSEPLAVPGPSSPPSERKDQAKSGKTTGDQKKSDHDKKKSLDKKNGTEPDKKKSEKKNADHDKKKNVGQDKKKSSETDKKKPKPPKKVLAKGAKAKPSALSRRGTSSVPGTKTPKTPKMKTTKTSADKPPSKVGTRTSAGKPALSKKKLVKTPGPKKKKLDQAKIKDAPRGQRSSLGVLDQPGTSTGVSGDLLGQPGPSGLSTAKGKKRTASGEPRKKGAKRANTGSGEECTCEHIVHHAECCQCHHAQQHHLPSCPRSRDRSEASDGASTSSGSSSSSSSSAPTANCPLHNNQQRFICSSCSSECCICTRPLVHQTTCVVPKEVVCRHRQPQPPPQHHLASGAPFPSEGPLCDDCRSRSCSRPSASPRNTCSCCLRDIDATKRSSSLSSASSSSSSSSSTTSTDSEAPKRKKRERRQGSSSPAEVCCRELFLRSHHCNQEECCLRCERHSGNRGTRGHKQEPQPEPPAETTSAPAASPPPPSAPAARRRGKNGVPVVPPYLKGKGTRNSAAGTELTAKKEPGLSTPRLSARLSTGRRKRLCHGWKWEGESFEKFVPLATESMMGLRKCYPAVKHKEGDVVYERDTVLLRAGAKDGELPYVAKIAAFWENPEDGEMLMSLLWYYRPEHTDQGRKPHQTDDEVFASKHRDVNSVACIDDKCYVLTFAEYCRYKATKKREKQEEGCIISLSESTVPVTPEGYPRSSRLPGEDTAGMVFFCRSVYDFRQRRILKNPT